MQGHLNPSTCKTGCLLVNKQEVIHEHDKEDDSGSSGSDDEDMGGVFGHKNAIRTNKNEGIMTRHKKKSSMNELAVDVDGPIKFIGGSSSNIQYQRVPQSATQPQLNGLSFNPNMSFKEVAGLNQGYSPTYPQMQNPFAHQVSYHHP
jgi:hypothetical protein